MHELYLIIVLSKLYKVLRNTFGIFAMFLSVYYIYTFLMVKEKLQQGQILQLYFLHKTESIVEREAR